MSKSLKKFIEDEVTKLHKTKLLESKKSLIEKELKLLTEGVDSSTDFQSHDEKEKDHDFVEYDIPEWALPTLINNDSSSLTDDEEQKLNDFVEKVAKAHGNAFFMMGNIDGDDDLGFKTHNDIDSLGGNVYRLYIQPSPSHLKENNADEDSKSDFSLDLEMVIFSHLSDIQETSSEASRKRINFIKTLVSELSSGKKTITNDELNKLWSDV